MKEYKKILITLAVVVVFIVLIILGYLTLTRDNSVDIYNDVTIFSKEYESLNGEELSGKLLLEVDINDEAVIYEKTILEILDIMNNESALIYFGFGTCPWCRNMIEALVDSSVSKNEPIYYVNISSVRNTYTYEAGNVVETKEGDESYYEVVEFLSDSLSEYYVYDEDGEKYDTNTKRLYAPTVITVKNGSLVDISFGTVDEVEDPYIKLTDEEYSDLLLEYNNMINDLQTEMCSLESC
ncbi:MAG: hypothetical protein R3Y13_04415 [bacterium]